MPAIITSKFRFKNAKAFKDSIASDSVYLFLGKSDTWGTGSVGATSDTVPANSPDDTLVDENDARQNMMALKKVANVVNIARRHNWTYNTPYVAWDDSDPLIFTKAFYVVTDSLNVYKCLKAGPANSTEKPSHTSTEPQFTGDGYLWKYMLQLGQMVATDTTNFLTTNNIPIRTVESDPGSAAPEYPYWTFQVNSRTSTKGKIYRIIVENGGTGYSQANPPTVTINGNYTTIAEATATVNAQGSVTSIDIKQITSGQNVEYKWGAGYTNAFVQIAAPVSGTTATARAVLTPLDGHGFNPVKELGAYYIGLTVKLEYAEGNDFVVDNAFRQIGLIRNPYDAGGTTVSTASTLSALRALRCQNHQEFEAGTYIVGALSNAVAFLDDYNPDATDDLTANPPVYAKHIKYHQNDKTGYKAFLLDENITGYTLNGTQKGNGKIADSNGLISAEVDRFSGEILFIENREPILRNDNQIEDIKIILEF